MADIKLTDIFGGVGGMSDQVILNKNDITQLRADLGTKVNKAGDTMTGKLTINRSGSGWPTNTVSNSNNFANRSILSAVTDNNALFIFGDGGFNSRRFGIQSGHADAGYTTTYGVLDLNPYGGAVRANGYQVYTGQYKQQELPARDIRGEARPPSYFTDKSVSAWFNNTGLPTSTWYSGIHVKGWEGSYNSWELFSHSSTGASDNKLHFRTGLNNTWNPTYEVYHSGRKPSPGDLGAYTKTETDNLFTKKAGDTCTGVIKFAANTTEPIELIAPSGTPNDTRIRGKTNAGAASWFVGTEGNNLVLYSNIHGHGMLIGTGYTQFGKELQATARLIAKSPTKDPDYHQGSIEVNATSADGAACLGFHIPGHSAHSLQMRTDFLGIKVLKQGKVYGNIAAAMFNAQGIAAGEGLVFYNKTAIGGVNDTWLRLNPHAQFSNGIYGGSTGTLRHDNTIQKGSWGSNAAAVIRGATDAGWSVAGDAAFSYIQTNSNSAHWLLASYKDGTNIRSGIQVLSNDGGNLRFYTNGRANFAEIADGNFLAQNNVTAYSDIRVKKNITRIENALEKTLSLNGVTYDRTDQDNVRQVGLIAQEVEKVLPEAVITSVNGDIKDFKSVAYGNLVGLLVESIRELNNKIERLEAQLKE